MDFERLRRCRLFLLDMDGTMYLTATPCRGAIGFMDLLARTGRRGIYLTNNSSHNHRDCARELRAMGLPCEEDGVFTAGMAAGLWMQRHLPGKRVYLVGTPALRAELAEYGVETTEDAPDAVLVGFDSTLEYGKLARATNLLRVGLPYIATNPDLVCPIEGGFIPDCGSICALLNAASGREPVYVGKPCRELVDLLAAQTGVPHDEICCVGDRLYTDIAVGVNAGTVTAAVLTGEATPELIAASDIKPDYVFEDIGALAEALEG